MNEAPAIGAARPAPLSRVVLVLAGVKLLAHLLTAGAFGYSYFVDELYFLACAKHLAWGYVDLPPLLPALTAIPVNLVGESLVAVRVLPALAGAALVVLAGLLAREMGGGWRSQALAALATLLAPAYLAVHSFNSMNALEPLAWMTGAWILLRLANGGSPRLWLWFGAVAGFGLLDKHTTSGWLVAVALGTLLTKERRHFATRWPWLGAALAFVLFLPNLLWNVAHRFPHLAHLAQVREDGRDVALSAAAFLGQQVLLLNPVVAPLWIGGLAWLLAAPAARRFRSVGFAYLAVLALLLAAHGRFYYLFPAYAVLFAAGAVAAEKLVARPWPLGTYAVVLGVTGVALAPFAFPCLPPATYVAYAKALRFDPPRIETHRLGPLPQLFADRFGWREMAEEAARIHRELPPEDRARAAVFGQNYGQAGAIDAFGPALGLPPAVSGHLAYHDWGPHGVTGEVLIVLGDRREPLESYFESVTLAGRVAHPYAMPYQHVDVFVCRKPRVSLSEIWPRLRKLG